MKALERLLTPDDVSRILGIKVQTLAAWRCRKRYRLPFVRSGRLVRYRASDVDEFIRRRTQSPIGPTKKSREVNEP